MAINDTYMLSVVGVVAGQDHVHTLHFRNMASVTPAADLIATWRTNCENAYRALFCTFDSPNLLNRVQHVCGSLPLEATEETAVPLAAQPGFRTASSNRSPPYMASLFKVRSAVAGKSRQGRFFIGGLLDTDHDLSDLSAAYIVLMNAYVAVVKSTFITGTLPPLRLVVHSRKLATPPGTPCTSSSTLATDIIANPRPTTMRSRKFGHGN